MKGTNHVSNMMWQFWCMMSSCFMNVQTLGLRTENNNNNAVPKEGELKEEASTVQTRAFLLSEWNTKPGYTGKKVRETGGGTWLGSISPLPSSENTFFVGRIHLRWAFFIPPPFESNLLVREVLPGAPVGIKHPTLTHRLPHKIKALPTSFHWKDRMKWTLPSEVPDQAHMKMFSFLGHKTIYFWFIGVFIAMDM